MAPAAEMPADAELLPEAIPYMHAFNILHGDRQIGAMGNEGPIPFIAIDAYARRHLIEDHDHFERFCRLIRAMDHEYLTIRAEQLREEQSRKQTAPTR